MERITVSLPDELVERVKCVAGEGQVSSYVAATLAEHLGRESLDQIFLQASLWRSLVLQYTRDRDLRWTVTAHSTEVVLLSPRQSLRVLAHYDGAGASLRIQQPVAE